MLFMSGAMTINPVQSNLIGVTIWIMMITSVTQVAHAQDTDAEIAKPQLTYSWSTDSSESEFRVDNTCYNGVLIRCKCTFANKFGTPSWAVHKKHCIGTLKSPQFAGLEYDVEPGYREKQGLLGFNSCTKEIKYWGSWQQWSTDTTDDDCGPDLWETRTRTCESTTSSNNVAGERGCSLSYYTDQGLLTPYKLIEDESVYNEQDTCYFDLSCDAEPLSVGAIVGIVIGVIIVVIVLIIICVCFCCKKKHAQANANTIITTTDTTTTITTSPPTLPNPNQNIIEMHPTDFAATGELKGSAQTLTSDLPNVPPAYQSQQYLPPLLPQATTTYINVEPTEKDEAK